eukprot:gene22210-biopygen11724
MDGSTRTVERWVEGGAGNCGLTMRHFLSLTSHSPGGGMNPTRPAALAAGYWCWIPPCALPCPVPRPCGPCGPARAALAGPTDGAAAAPSGAGQGRANRRPLGGGHQGEGGMRKGHARRVERRLSDTSLLLWCGVPCCGVPAKSLAGGPCRLVKESPKKTAWPWCPARPNMPTATPATLDLARLARPRRSQARVIFRLTQNHHWTAVPASLRRCAHLIGLGCNQTSQKTPPTGVLSRSGQEKGCASRCHFVDILEFFCKPPLKTAGKRGNLGYQPPSDNPAWDMESASPGETRRTMPNIPNHGILDILLAVRRSYPPGIK